MIKAEARVDVDDIVNTRLSIEGDYGDIVREFVAVICAVVTELSEDSAFAEGMTTDDVIDFIAAVAKKEIKEAQEDKHE